MSRILVTGGCGFIGSNLTIMLSKMGHDVRVFDNLSTGNMALLGDLGIEMHIGDIRNSHEIKKVLEDIDGVIHLAAYGSVVASVDNPYENFEINVLGTFNLLNECRKNNIKNIVLASTGGALIGNATPPVDESSLPRPISPYGAGKLCCEAYSSSFSHSYGMSITALRFANVMGPNSWHKKGAVTAFMKAILRGEKITIYGDGSATRDFLYVEDLCSGIVAAYEKSLPGFNPIHLASGQEVSIRELAKLIAIGAGKPDYPIQHLTKRVGEVERNFASYDFANKVLGFEPSISLQEGIGKTWSWLKNYAKK
jgi:UDP-glucose 4-epimerase